MSQHPNSSSEAGQSGVSASAAGAQWAGVLFALAATIIWSGNFIVARGLTDIVPPITLAFLRWSTAFCVLLPLAWKSLVRDWGIVRRQWRYLAVTSLIGIAVFNTLLYVAAATTTALNLSLIATTSPMFILLFARMFLGEPVTYRRLAGVALAVAGIVLLVTRGNVMRLVHLQFAIGDLWMLIAAMLFGAYSILVRRIPEKMESAAFLVALFGMGVVMLAPGALWEWHQGKVFTLSPAILGTIAYVGVGASLIAFWCWNRSVTLVGPSQAGVVYYSLPLFSGAEAVVLLGEPVTWVHLISGVCILGGIWIATRVHKPIRSAPAE